MASEEIIVSISCITYNHAPYIRQCLDGFMMQQTDFDFEVLIHDDASTDGTAEIIKEYEAKYPNIIKPIYEEENQWVKGRRGSAVFNFPRAKGKYIAICEGDDYWTDHLKLQKQVDFLEGHNEYSLCGHRFMAYVENLSKFIPHGHNISGSFDLGTLVNEHKFCSTLSIMFRKTALNIDEFMKHKQTMDIVLYYHLLKNGKGYCLPDLMAVYRIHDGGVWTNASRQQRILTDINIRLGIYEVDRTRSAATFIKTYLSKFVGRKWLLTHLNILWSCLQSMIEQFGLLSTVRYIVCDLIIRRNASLVSGKKS